MLPLCPGSKTDCIVVKKFNAFVKFHVLLVVTSSITCYYVLRVVTSFVSQICHR